MKPTHACPLVAIVTLVAGCATPPDSVMLSYTTNPPGALIRNTDTHQWESTAPAAPADPEKYKPPSPDQYPHRGYLPA